MSNRKKLTLKAQSAIRREEVGNLHLKGLTRPQIASQLKINVRTVSRYMAQLRREWKKETAPDQMILLTQELLRIKRLEIAAWDAWEESKQDQVTTKQSKEGKQGSAQQKEEQTTRNQSGNPTFLQLIAQCILRRCQLMGLHQMISGNTINQHILTLYQISSEAGINLHATDTIDALRDSACQADLVASSLCQSGQPRMLENGAAPKSFRPGLN